MGCSKYQPLYDEMKNEISNIEFHQGLPSMDVLSEWGAVHGHKIVVFDDLMMDAAESSELVHLMCVGSHHHQITVIHILQNLFQKGKCMRTASLQAHYILVFKNKRDSQQLACLGRQILPGQSKFFMDAFQKATSRPYGYLLLDLNPHTDISYQLRTDILPGQSTVVYQAIK